jgi:hypothetical protein
MTTWIGDRGDRGGGNGAKRKTWHQTSAGDGVKVGEIYRRSQKVAESETWRVEKAYWAQTLTGSGLDLEPETEVTKLRMARRT